MKKKKESNIFLGCMFVGIGIGFYTQNIPMGTMIGMGIGLLGKAF